jgi:hypothetical protein
MDGFTIMNRMELKVMIVDIFDEKGNLFHSDTVITNLGSGDAIELAKENLISDKLVDEKDIKKYTFNVRI